MSRAADGDLRPYVPRVLLEWGTGGDGPRHRRVDGSMVFADVSGFTRLSERLARLGQVGAEELTIVLDRVFDALLTSALSYGGSMLKFGGDAVLLLFWGEGHAPRAAASALAMQEALSTAGRVVTPSGPVRLRMSVGVDAGTFDLFVVGESHRELIVCGEATSRVVALESAASAGQIAAGAALLDAVRPHQPTLGPPVGAGRLLRRIRGVTPLPPAPVPDADAAAFVPAALRRHLGDGGHQPEHRTAAVAFIGFGRVDERLSSGRVEETAEALHHLVIAAQAAADTYDVAFLASDVAAGGGKLILAGGAPTAIEEQEERVLRATAEVVAAGAELDARAGVHRGPVFAGDVGPTFRRTYTILGDAVNTAARVLAKPAPGQVLATPDVLERTSSVFVAEPIEPFLAKGKARPLEAAIVGPPSPRLPAADAAPAPLVGREAELTGVLALADAARRGTGGCVELVAEAGYGKTRLLDELRATCVDFDVLATRAEPYDAALPWHTARALLLQLLPEGTDDPVAALRMRLSLEAPHLLARARFLAAVLGGDGAGGDDLAGPDAADARADVVRAVVDVLVATSGGPRLIVVDDAQWVDPASADVVAALAAEAGRRPWLVAVARRPSGQQVAGATVVELHPLPPEQAAELAWAASRAQLLPSVADDLAGRSGGVPLFVLELVRAAAVGHADDADALPSLIAARIDRLRPTDRAVLRELAVLGSTFPVDLATSVVGVPAGTLSRFEGLLDVDGATARFAQPIFHEVAYEGLPHRRRREIHRAVAEELERTAKPGDEPAELLALHYGRGGFDADAHRHARVAGERAERRWARLSAARFYAAAAEHGRRAGVADAVVAACRGSEGEMLLQLGDYDGALRALNAARRIGSDAASLARWAMLSGECRRRSGHLATAMRWYRSGDALVQAAAAAGTADDDIERVRFRLRLGAGITQMNLGRLNRAVATLHRALEATPPDDRRGSAFAWYLLHQAYLRLGQQPPEPYASLAASVYEELGDHRMRARVLNLVGMDAHRRGDWDAAVDAYGASRSALLESGDHVAAAAVGNNLAELLLDLGRPGEARRALEDALAVATAAGHREYVLVVTGNLGRLEALEGDFVAADRRFDEALAGFDELGLHGHADDARARVAERHLLEGRAADAVALCESLAPKVARALRPLVLRLRGEARVALGDPRGVDDLRAAVAEAAEVRARHERELALAALARATAGEGVGEPTHA